MQQSHAHAPSEGAEEESRIRAREVMQLNGHERELQRNVMPSHAMR